MKKYAFCLALWRLFVDFAVIFGPVWCFFRVLSGMIWSYVFFVGLTILGLLEVIFKQFVKASGRQSQVKFLFVLGFGLWQNGNLETFLGQNAVDWFGLCFTLMVPVFLPKNQPTPTAGACKSSNFVYPVGLAF